VSTTACDHASSKGERPASLALCKVVVLLRSSLYRGECPLREGTKSHAGLLAGMADPQLHKRCNCVDFSVVP